MASVLRTLLVDSDAESLTTLRRVLAASPGAVIVGEFSDVTQAVVEGPARNPDLLIMEIPRDVAAQGADAATRVIENVSQALPNTAILASGPALPADVVIRLIRAGAVEFLSRPVERGAGLGAPDSLPGFNGGSQPHGGLVGLPPVSRPKAGL